MGFEFVSGGVVGQGSNAESEEAATIRDKHRGDMPRTGGYRYILAVSSTFGFVGHCGWLIVWSDIYTCVYLFG